MIQLHKSITIGASPETVWAVLGDLTATREWLPGTKAARMEGSTRVCETVDGEEIREEISDYSPERRSYRYRHLRIPLHVESSAGQFSVRAAPEGSALVDLEAEFELRDSAPAEVGPMFEAALEQALESLKLRVEQGTFWQAA